MKKFLLISLCCMISHCLIAQGQIANATYKHEISAGASILYSTLDVRIPEGYKLKGDPHKGYAAQLFYANNISRYFSIQTGILYHSLFNTLQFPDKSKYLIHMDNLHIPLLFRLNSDEWSRLSYHLFLGPQASLNIASSSQQLKRGNNHIPTTKSETGSERVLAVAGIEAGLTYGGGVSLGITETGSMKFNLGYIGTIGISDLSGNVNGDSTNLLEDQTTKNTFGAYGSLTFAF